MLVQIGVFLMALSFAIFSVALSKLLLHASKSMEVFQSTARNMESKFDGTIKALEGTLDNTNRTISDMETKSNALDSVFVSAEKLGDAVHVMSKELDEMTKGYVETGNTSGTRPFIRIIQGAELVKGLVKSWKRGQTISTK